MIIDAFILCYNESLMIRHTMNHYLKFCNNITVIDNYSSDDSLTILKSEFPSVNIQYFETSNLSREDIQTHIKNTCWKNSKADYVIVCDMDEFLYHSNLEENLSLLKTEKPALCNIVGFDMFSKTFPNDFSKAITNQIKTGVRNFRFDKTIIFNPKKVKEINYDFGAHSCNPEYYNKDISDSLVEFKLLHYKYLSKDYLYKKHLNYSNRLSKLNILNTWGKEYLKGKKYINQQFKKAEEYHINVIP